MNPEANRTLVLELIDAVMRSWWTIVAGVCLGLTAALLALHNTPKLYQATAKVLITPQEIRKDIFESTVTEDLTRRMMALEEAVIRDDYMIRLIEQKIGVPETPEEMRSLIRSVRNRVSVKPQLNPDAGWLAFDLTFRDTDPERSAAIANALAEIYIDQNTDFRREQARETTRTIEGRLEEARAAFDGIDRRLNDFNAAHKFETEAQLDANLRLLENAKKDLEHVRAQRKLTDEKLQQHQDDLTQLKAGSNSGAEQIARVQRELQDLLVTYSEAHPTVIRKRRELEDLVAASKAAPAASDVKVARDPQVTDLEQRITTIRLELGALDDQEDRLQRQIAEYNRRIQAVPEVQPRLTALQNEHTLLRARLQDLQDKADKAKESQFLEESEKGSRFELAERAEIPGAPYFPDPKRFYPLGVLAGLAVFLGPLLLRRLLQPPLASEAGMRAVLDAPVLVSIPRIPTPANKGLALRRVVTNVGLSAVSASILVAAKMLL